MSFLSAEPSCQSLLWIDDQLLPEDACLRLLALEGLCVDIASTGSEGIEKARRGAYGGIVLDMRLPDGDGLEVLKRLLQGAPSLPVLILTGYPNYETAVTCMKLGAWDFKAKSIMLDRDWIHIIRELLSAGKAKSAHYQLTCDVGQSAPQPSCAPLFRLLKELELLTADGDTISVNICRANSVEASSDARLRDALSACLLQCCTVQSVSLASFLACAAAIRAGVDKLPARAVDRANAAHATLLESIHAYSKPWPLDVHAAVEELLQVSTARPRILECEIAADLGRDPSSIGRMLRRHTGWGFREWRHAPVLREAARRLLTTGEHVDQIAYALGYEHPSQFAREFRVCFNSCPTEFRHLFG